MCEGVAWVLTNIIETQVAASTIILCTCVLAWFLGRAFPPVSIGAIYALYAAWLLLWLLILFLSCGIAWKNGGFIGLFTGLFLGRLERDTS